MRAGQADGRHGGFGPGADEANFLNSRHRAHDLFRQVGLGRSCGAEAGAVAGGGFNGGHDLGMSMSQDQRPPRANVVNVLVAIGIPHARARAANDDRRRTAYGGEGAHGGIDTAGDKFFGAFLQQAGFFEAARHDRKP